jgi:type III secretion protein D
MRGEAVASANDTIETDFHAGAPRVDEAYAFEIRSGLYLGLTHAVAEGRHLFGSGEDCDLVLLEPGLATTHAAIVLEGDTIRVEGLAEGVAVEGAGLVPPGAARTVRLPAVVRIGPVETAWRGSGAAEEAPAPQAALPAWRRFLQRPAMPGIAAAGFLAATLFLTVAKPIADAASLAEGARGAVSAVPEAGTPATLSAPSPAREAVPGPNEGPVKGAPKEARDIGRTAPAPSQRSLETATASLRAAVEGAGLLNVHLSSSGGAVSASGTVEPAQARRWEALQKEFDERFVGEVTLVNSVAVKAEKLPASLGIEGVWRGPQPYIVVRGQRYLVGAVVDGGWAIRGIEADRVMLEREGRLVAMRF